jgi:hypothetical protein
MCNDNDAGRLTKHKQHDAYKHRLQRGCEGAGATEVAIVVAGEEDEVVVVGGGGEEGGGIEVVVVVKRQETPMVRRSRTYHHLHNTDAKMLTPHGVQSYQTATWDVQHAGERAWICIRSTQTCSADTSVPNSTRRFENGSLTRN